MYGNNIRVLAYIILGTINLNIAAAQDIWIDNNHKKLITLEILKPNQDRINPSFSRKAAYLTGKFPLLKKTRIVAELPFADYEARTTIGNPYFGIESHFKKSPIVGELGMRAPLLNEIHGFAGSVGRKVDRVDRYEAFGTEGMTISGALNYSTQNKSGMFLKLRAGSIYWFAAGELIKNEAFIVYSVQAGYRLQRLNVLAGTSGRYRITALKASLTDSFLHQLGLVINIDCGVFQPGIIFRLPLGNKNTDSVLGLILGINL